MWLATIQPIKTFLGTSTQQYCKSVCVIGYNTTNQNIVCQWHVAGRWFSLGTPVSSTNKTDHHDITEILLKVALNTITLLFTKICIPQIKYNQTWFICLEFGTAAVQGQNLVQLSDGLP